MIGSCFEIHSIKAMRFGDILLLYVPTMILLRPAYAFCAYTPKRGFTTVCMRAKAVIATLEDDVKGHLWQQTSPPRLYVQEGLFAVKKPLGWTSQQVVGKVRAMLERDAKERGVRDRRKKRRRPWMKVGHGGTLDPLATGVLVIGVGEGTKQLQSYLKGSKGYRAEVELGYQTTTLDLDPTGVVVSRKPFDHVTRQAIEAILPQFRGKLQQTPPLFSALKKDGKRLYELGRLGKEEDEVDIKSRQVEIHRLDLVSSSSIDERKDDKVVTPVSKFAIDVDCGGGTYIRSLVRDLGLALTTVATMISLERTKQGIFLLEHCLEEDDWTAEKVWNAIEVSQDLLASDALVKSEGEIIPRQSL